jgi:hypothetical protein
MVTSLLFVGCGLSGGAAASLDNVCFPAADARCASAGALGVGHGLVGAIAIGGAELWRSDTRVDTPDSHSQLSHATLVGTLPIQLASRAAMQGADDRVDARAIEIVHTQSEEVQALLLLCGVMASCSWAQGVVQQALSLRLAWLNDGASLPLGTLLAVCGAAGLSTLVSGQITACSTAAAEAAASREALRLAVERSPKLFALEMPQELANRRAEAFREVADAHETHAQQAKRKDEAAAAFRCVVAASVYATSGGSIFAPVTASLGSGGARALVRRLRGGAARAQPRGRPRLPMTRRAMITSLGSAVATAAVIPTSCAATDAVTHHPPVPIIDVIQTYGRLASPRCFGKTSAAGSVCQLTLDDALQKLGLGPESPAAAALDEAAFRAALDGQHFAWPLKPWGTAGSEASNARTATMNKNAETAVYMAELESRGMYNPRNPAGPLPTSLRPALDRAIETGGINPQSVGAIFRALAANERSGSGSGGAGASVLSASGLERAFSQAATDLGTGEPTTLDYYGFLHLIQREVPVVWP